MNRSVSTWFVICDCGVQVPMRGRATKCPKCGKELPVDRIDWPGKVGETR